MSKSDKLAVSFTVILAVAVAVGVFFFYPKKTTAPSSLQPIVQPSDPHAPIITDTTIFFGGDIMLSRNVDAKMNAASDFTLPFKNIADVTQKADIAFANLESPFNDTGRHFIDGSLVFNADPKAIDGLKLAGFDILSTANNHALDQGTKGIDITTDLLFKNNIIPTGTKSTTLNPILPVIKKNNISFDFLSYSYTALNDGGKSTSPYVNNFNDLKKLKQDIVDLKGHNADVVIVNMHAGTEYTRNPSAAQIAFAHAAIDAGADLVVGEHPHWIQTIEKYNDKWIFYSLGNLVFDQMWSTDTREGLTLLVTYEHTHLPDPTNNTAGEDKLEIKKVELKPVVIDNFCCPRWADNDETKSILQKIDLTSPSL